MSAFRRKSQITEGQRRNRRWLATHTGTVAAVGAAVFALIGLGYAALVSDALTWFTPPLGAALGAVFGALAGYGFSLGNRDKKLKGRQRAIYFAIAVILIAAVLGMRYIRYTT